MLEEGFARSGPTPSHRLTYRTAHPQLMMFAAQMQTCFAAEGKHLLVAQSAAAENDLRARIDRVRDGRRVAQTHSAAMRRLMPDRHEGLSIQLGALEPILGMAALAFPEAGRAVAILPDDLYFSTALALHDSHIHFRGDFPLQECVDYATKLAGLFP